MENVCEGTGQYEVSIACEGTNIVTVPQRDLFSKYDWPAEEPILEALNKFKTEGADGLPLKDEEVSLDDEFMQG